jgi:cytochrome d ubiquinol oxidase subunit I
MFTLGFILILLSLLAVVYGRKDALESRRLFLTIMLFAIPLPYLAAQLGWIVAEVGRQPWIVYGVLKTSAAVSQSISTAQVWVSLLGFTLLYGSLGVVDIYLLTKYAKRGPR